MGNIILDELYEAEKKAIDALSRYKFQMFGYWAAIWVHLNRKTTAANAAQNQEDQLKKIKTQRRKIIMCQCGCADIRPIRAFQVGSDKYLVLSTYAGCDQCATDVGYFVYFFDEKGLKNYSIDQEVLIEKAEFNEYGGKNCGEEISLIDREDIVKIISQETADGYNTLGDWFEEEGYHLLRQVINKQFIKGIKAVTKNISVKDVVNRKNASAIKKMYKKLRTI